MTFLSLSHILFYLFVKLGNINFVPDSFKEFENETPKLGISASPASNLTIQLELMSWKSVVNITGDKKLVKKIIKPGEGFGHPNEGSFVKGKACHEYYICTSSY